MSLGMTGDRVKRVSCSPQFCTLGASKIMPGSTYTVSVNYSRLGKIGSPTQRDSNSDLEPGESVSAVLLYSSSKQLGRAVGRGASNKTVLPNRGAQDEEASSAAQEPRGVSSFP